MQDQPKPRKTNLDGLDCLIKKIKSENIYSLDETLDIDVIRSLNVVFLDKQE